MRAQIPFDRSLPASFYQQIYEGYRAAIIDGRLRPGDRLPATRELADDLGLSRTPVLDAFARLRDEGYLEGRVGAGTFVAQPTFPAPGSTAGRADDGTASEETLPADGWLPHAIREPRIRFRPFHRGLPAVDLFPDHLWERLLRRHFDVLAHEFASDGDLGGLWHLRECVAAYFRTVRFVDCDPEQVLVVSGSRMALQMCALALLEPNASVGVEPCTWLAAHHGLGALRIPIELIPAEDPGDGDDALTAAMSERVSLAHVTPSDRYLFGRPMGDRRRRHLLNWAEANHRWILEGDYDSALRHDERRSLPLYNEAPGRVIYLVTFVRSMFPGLKVAFLVVPRSILRSFRRVQQAMAPSTSLLDQSALADFIEEGHYARHVRRLRPIYTERRDALLDSLRRHGSDIATAHSVDAGLDLAITFPVDAPDRDVARKAAEEGISTIALSYVYPERNGLILGFGCATPDRLDTAAQSLLGVIRSVSGTDSSNSRRLVSGELERVNRGENRVSGSRWHQGPVG